MWSGRTAEQCRHLVLGYVGGRSVRLYFIKRIWGKNDIILWWWNTFYLSCSKDPIGRKRGIWVDSHPWIPFPVKIFSSSTFYLFFCCCWGFFFNYFYHFLCAQHTFICSFSSSPACPPHHIQIQKDMMDSCWWTARRFWSPDARNCLFCILRCKNLRKNFFFLIGFIFIF